MTTSDESGQPEPRLIRLVTAGGWLLTAAGVARAIAVGDGWAFTLILLGGFTAVGTPVAVGLYAAFWGEGPEDAEAAQVDDE
jgi:hypothetical protein